MCGYVIEIICAEFDLQFDLGAIYASLMFSGPSEDYLLTPPRPLSLLLVNHRNLYSLSQPSRQFYEEKLENRIFSFTTSDFFQ